MFLVKELVLVDKSQKCPVSTLKLRSAPRLRADTALYDMLRLFETGRCHMAVLSQPPETTEKTTAECFVPELSPPNGEVHVPIRQSTEQEPLLDAEVTHLDLAMGACGVTC